MTTNQILSIKEIVQFLEPNQIKIPIKTDALHLEKTLPAFVHDFISKYISADKQLYTCPPVNKNHFMAAFLYMTDAKFPLYNTEDRVEAIEELRKIMGYQLDEKNLHSKFNYTRKRKFKKIDLQKNLFNLQKSIEELYPDDLINNPVNQYLVDFFGINLFILNADQQKVSYLLTNLDRPNMLKPTFFMFVENSLFHPLVEKDDDSYYILSKHPFLEPIYLKFSKISSSNTTDDPSPITTIDDDEVDADPEVVVEVVAEVDTEVEAVTEVVTKIDWSKLTVKELQKMAAEKGVSIWKKSDKTAKNIFKKKNELIDDLSN